MWWPIIENMRDFFRNHDALTEVTVEVGNGAIESAYPAIFISWSQAEGGLARLMKGKIAILLAEYVESGDPDPATGYAKLYELQERRQAALAAWMKENQLLLALNIVSQKMTNDSSIMTPVYGNKTVLEVEWKA